MKNLLFITLFVALLKINIVNVMAEGLVNMHISSSASDVIISGDYVVYDSQPEEKKEYTDECVLETRKPFDTTIKVETKEGMHHCGILEITHQYLTKMDNADESDPGEPFIGYLYTPVPSLEQYPACRDVEIFFEIFTANRYYQKKISIAGNKESATIPLSPEQDVGCTVKIRDTKHMLPW